MPFELGDHEEERVERIREALREVGRLTFDVDRGSTELLENRRERIVPASLLIEVMQGNDDKPGRIEIDSAIIDGKFDLEFMEYHQRV